MRDPFPKVDGGGFARLAEAEVGVVIADQRMPGMAGTELLARVAEEKPDVVRIVLTAYADVGSLLDAINAGRAVVEIQHEPALASLRSDPRFAQLMADRASKVQ